VEHQPSTTKHLYAALLLAAIAVPSTIIVASAATTTATTAAPTTSVATSTRTSGTTSTATSGATAGTPGAGALAPGQLAVANRIAGRFATVAGSQENALALAIALRTGTAATLTTTSTDASGATVTTTTTMTPPTKPMGWGNVSHSLALAQTALAKAGVANPTSTDLQAALLGGTVTAADGTSATVTGVLEQRAGGMGWGQIAKTYGTTMGAVNRGVTAAAPPPTSTASTAPTTAVGAPTTKGFTTAASAPPSSPGVVTASGGGNGQALGRGIVTATGSSAGPGNSALHRAGTSTGVTTAGGTHGAGVVTANGRDGANQGRAKGKGGG
jgi:hypothetical protein